MTSRREVLLVVGMAIPGFLFPGSALGLTDAEVRPNVLVIMADDLGYGHLSCYGGEIQTPNIDGLAAEGPRFKQFYNTGRCCPTPASLLTGLHPHQVGIGHMTETPPLPSPLADEPIARN